MAAKASGGNAFTVAWNPVPCRVRIVHGTGALATVGFYQHPPKNVSFGE